MVYQFFDPLKFGFEFFYSTIVFFSFFFIFFKTKEIFTISKHEGVQYFRYSFLFFALAYFSRLTYQVVKLIIMSSGISLPGWVLSYPSLILISYFGTIAICFLIYSQLWKFISYKKFLLLSNLFAILIVLFSLFTFSMTLFGIIQFLLIVIIIAINYNKPIKFLYALISLFWILNLIIFYSGKVLSFTVKLSFQLASLFLLAYFIYRILKWIK